MSKVKRIVLGGERDRAVNHNYSTGYECQPYITGDVVAPVLPHPSATFTKVKVDPGVAVNGEFSVKVSFTAPNGEETTGYTSIDILVNEIKKRLKGRKDDDRKQDS